MKTFAILMLGASLVASTAQAHSGHMSMPFNSVFSSHETMKSNDGRLDVSDRRDDRRRDLDGRMGDRDHRGERGRHHESFVTEVENRLQQLTNEITRLQSELSRGHGDRDRIQRELNRLNGIHAHDMHILIVLHRDGGTLLGGPSPEYVLL